MNDPINHESLRATGDAMHRSIAEFEENPEAHHEVVASLTELTNDVPYDDIFAAYDQVATSVGKIAASHDKINEDLIAEQARLDGLATTMANRLGVANQSAAKTLLESKRTAAVTEARAKIDADAPIKQTLIEAQVELDETIESVGRAWPVKPYTQETIDAAAELFDEDEEDYDEAPVRRIQRPERIVEEVIPGPYADLAASIPSLSERLSKMESAHIHVYDETITALTYYDTAILTKPEERTDEQNKFIMIVSLLQNRFLSNPKDITFLQVYEPDDVIELFKRLNKFRKKNRPDFDDVELRILEKADVRIRNRSQSSNVEGAIERMEAGEPNRRGMTWRSLTTNANRACDTMRARFFSGGVANQHLKNYIIEVGDSSPTKPDLSWVYQFIADDFAFDILGARRSNAGVSAKQIFLDNCDVIEKWTAEVDELLKQVPEGLRLLRTQTLKERKTYFGKKGALYENVSAVRSIRNTAVDIIERKKGKSRQLRHKAYHLNPMGAINHQLKLGHMVDELKESLIPFGAGSGGSTEEITPFE